jgi:hypothetical protein
MYVTHLTLVSMYIFLFFDDEMNPLLKPWDKTRWNKVKVDIDRYIIIYIDNTL